MIIGKLKINKFLDLPNSHDTQDAKYLENIDSSSSHEPLEHHISDLEVEGEANEVHLVTIHEEDHVHENTQELLSFSHEDNDMVSHGCLQISKFDDIHIDDLEMDVMIKLQICLFMHVMRMASAKNIPLFKILSMTSMDGLLVII
jgi:hypothetical protein